MNDNEWMEQFEQGALINGPFHHADHVKMAFLYLQHTRHSRRFPDFPLP